MLPSLDKRVSGVIYSLLSLSSYDGCRGNEPTGGWKRQMQTQDMNIEQRITGADMADRALSPARTLLPLGLLGLDLLGLRLIRP